MTSTITATGVENLRHCILQRIAPVLRAAEVDDHEITCEITGSIGNLQIVLRGPARAASVSQALGVRVHDAIRADGRTFGAVGVRYLFDDDGTAD